MVTECGGHLRGGGAAHASMTLPGSNGMNAPTLGGTGVCQSGVAYPPFSKQEQPS